MIGSNSQLAKVLLLTITLFMAFWKKTCTRAGKFRSLGLGFGPEPQTPGLETCWTRTRVLPSKTRTRLETCRTRDATRENVDSLQLCYPCLNQHHPVPFLNPNSSTFHKDIYFLPGILPIHQTIHMILLFSISGNLLHLVHC